VSTTLPQTDEDERGRVLRRVACAMGLYTISFLLLAWPLYYLVPEILFPVFFPVSGGKSFRVVSLLGVNVELLSLIFLAVSLVAGLAASYLLMKSGQTINTALKRGAKILFYTHASMLLILVSVTVLLGFASCELIIVLGLPLLAGIVVLAVGLFQIGKEYGSSAAGAGAVLLALGAVLTILAPYLAHIITSPMLTAGAALAYLGLGGLADKSIKCGVPLAAVAAALVALMLVLANSVVERHWCPLIVESATLVNVGDYGLVTVTVRQLGEVSLNIEKVRLVKDGDKPVCEDELENKTVPPGASLTIMVKCKAPIVRDESYYVVIECKRRDVVMYTDKYPVVAR